jgi:type 1 glutamine amidotransferase
MRTARQVVRGCALALAIGTIAVSGGAAGPRKIVLIAGRKSHGPGEHEYLKSIKLLKVLLDRSPNLHGIQTEIYFNGWPNDPETLDTADTIVVISDGQDHDESSRVPIFTPERMRIMEKQMKRGCGFITFHFSTFISYEYAEQVLEWGGGFYEWDEARGRVSAIKTLDTDVKLGSPDHPISNGVAPFHYKDEFYYNMRFRERDPRLKLILQVPALSSVPEDQTVAWAVERKNGGRGFGTTTGHYYENWRNENYRKLILNAIVWTAGADVPAGGVQSTFVEDDEVNRALLTHPVPVLIVTGDSDPGHRWQETTPALIAALNSEVPRFQVTVSEDAEVLAQADLSAYKLIILNYVNWNHSALSEAGKESFVRYLKGGGGLAIIHFADAAFGPDLPGGAAAHWPEYRQICRRVWDESKSTHDPYGPFLITVADATHPAAHDVVSFKAKDELYGNQQGEQPIHVLATAHSKESGREEPVAFVYDYAKGRVFQTVLGHDAAAIRTPGTTQLIRYGSLWAAKEE